MKQMIFAIALICLSFLFPTYATSADNGLKILVLIIASDTPEVYVELQKCWRSYMHLDPEHVEAYFIKGDPDLAEETIIDGDVIWSKTDEGWSPQSAGIINKTIMSMEAMLPRLDEFDYVLRTNLSSFYIFPRLLERLKTLPRKKCYFASAMGEISISGPTFNRKSQGSGCGIVMSPDVVKMLINDRDSLIGQKELADDQLIYFCLRNHKVPYTGHHRMDFLSIEDWNGYKDQISPGTFQIRVKSKPENRLKDDIYIYSELVKMFYGEFQEGQGFW